MLKIKNITAKIRDNNVLEKIDLEVNSGEIHAILGPKHSGKSSLVQVIAGNPLLEIKEGSVLFKRKAILKKTPDQRSVTGIFTAFQYPPVLDGISNFEMSKEILKAHKDTRNLVEVEKEYKSLLKKLGLSSNHGSKWVNDETVTITESKKNELLQMLLLNPDLVVLDEIDQEVETEELESIAEHIKNFLSKKNKAAIVVTQNIDFLKMLNPTHVNVIVDGSIKTQGSKELIKRIVKDGYSQFS
jgi:Fe-S cluster assembly ATP-binding protein